MWAAIRYRRAQAVALMLLSALLTACAVFAPLYERALEQSLLRDGLTRQSALSTSIVGESVQSPVSSPQPAGIRGIFPVERRQSAGADVVDIAAHQRARRC